MRRSTVIAALVCLNLMLLTGIVLSSYSLPPAYAQTAGLATDYLVVAGEIQDEHDAIYLVDIRNRMLHVLYFDRGQRQLRWGASRDLEQDFRYNRG